MRGKSYRGSSILRAWETDEAERIEPRRAIEDEEDLFPKPRAIRVRRASWLHVTDEARALMRVVSCGSLGWRRDIDGLRFTGGGIGTYRVRVLLRWQEDSDRVEGPLKWLGSLDTDCCFALQALLAPPEELSGRSGEWEVAERVKLDEVIASAGWTAKDRVKRLEYRRRAWDLIRLVARVEVKGSRAADYYERGVRRRGKAIDTSVSGAPWILMDWDSRAEVPEWVMLVRTPGWGRLLSRPETAEWMPWRETLCRIPSGRTPGAWAQVIGLRLAELVHKQEVFPVSRRDLLCHYRPTSGAVEGFMMREHCGYAVDYFESALRILCERGLITEELNRLFEQVPRVGRVCWTDEWMTRRIRMETARVVGVGRRAADGRGYTQIEF